MIQAHNTYPGIEILMFNQFSKLENNLRVTQPININTINSNIEQAIQLSDELVTILRFFNQNAHDLSVKDAKKALPTLKKIRANAWSIEDLLTHNEYLTNEMLRENTNLLVRYSNQSYSIVHSIAFKNNEVLETPTYLKQKFHHNSITSLHGLSEG